MDNDEAKTSKDIDASSKRAGRGFLVISLAKGWFMVGGASITFGLPIIFSLYAQDGRELYGRYYDINNTLSIFSMVLIGGLLPAVSRFAASDGTATGHLLKIGNRVAIGLALLFSVGFIAMSGPYAAQRGHPEESFAYICAGVICAAYSFYAVHVGIINGRQAFSSQAKLDIGFTTLKLLFILGIACIGFGVTGAFIGFALAAVFIAFWSKTQLPDISENNKLPDGFISFACWMMIYTLAFNLSFKLDALMLRPALNELQLAAHQVDQFMGEYGLAVSLSRLPWQSTIALTFVVFPMISEATFAHDEERTRQYIQNTIRYAMILICLVALPMCARPDYVFDCLGLVMSGYSDGRFALSWLAPAYVLFSLSNLHNTILMSSGRAKSALTLMVVNLVCIITALELGFGNVEKPIEILHRAGLITFCAFGIVVILGALWISKVFKGYLSVRSIVRIATAAVISMMIGQFLSTDLLLAKVACLLGTPIYFLVFLWVLGELNEDDKKRLSQVFRRQKANANANANDS